MLLLVDWWFWWKLLLYHFTVIPRSEKFFCILGTWEMGWLCPGRIRQATQTLFSLCVGPWHYAWYGVFLLCGECCPNSGGVFVPHLSSLETLRFPLWRNMSIRESLTILNVMFTRSLESYIKWGLKRLPGHWGGFYHSSTQGRQIKVTLTQ